jgi:hypothetical protein
LVTWERYAMTYRSHFFCSYRRKYAKNVVYPRSLPIEIIMCAAPNNAFVVFAKYHSIPPRPRCCTDICPVALKKTHGGACAVSEHSDAEIREALVIRDT